MTYTVKEIGGSFKATFNTLEKAEFFKKKSKRFMTITINNYNTWINK